MKKFLLGTVALVALGATVPALAADLGARTYTKAPAYAPAPIYNWTGFYIGGNIGGAFNGNNGFNGAGVTTSNNNGAFLGGLQAGADYQFAPSWVAGGSKSSTTHGSAAATAPPPYSRPLRSAPTPSTRTASARSPAASVTPGVPACSTPRAVMPIPTTANL